MRTWARMLGGLIVWSVHFLGVYLISSAADLASTADDLRWRLAALGFSVACAVAAASLLVAATRRLSRGGFADHLAALGAGLATIAIIWQTLPTVIGH